MATEAETFQNNVDFILKAVEEGTATEGQMRWYNDRYLTGEYLNNAPAAETTPNTPYNRRPWLYSGQTDTGVGIPLQYEDPNITPAAFRQTYGNAYLPTGLNDLRDRLRMRAEGNMRRSGRHELKYGGSENAYGKRAGFADALESLYNQGYSFDDIQAILNGQDVSPSRTAEQVASQTASYGAPAAPTDYSPQIAEYYEELFGRAPAAAGSEYWNQQLQSGAVSPENLQNALIQGAYAGGEGGGTGADYQSYLDTLGINRSNNPFLTEGGTYANIPYGGDLSAYQDNSGAAASTAGTATGTNTGDTMAGYTGDATSTVGTATNTDNVGQSNFDRNVQFILDQVAAGTATPGQMDWYNNRYLTGDYLNTGDTTGTNANTYGPPNPSSFTSPYQPEFGNPYQQRGGKGSIYGTGGAGAKGGNRGMMPPMGGGRMGRQYITGNPMMSPYGMANQYMPNRGLMGQYSTGYGPYGGYQRGGYQRGGGKGGQMYGGYGGGYQNPYSNPYLSPYSNPYSRGSGKGGGYAANGGFRNIGGGQPQVQQPTQQPNFDQNLQFILDQVAAGTATPGQQNYYDNRYLMGDYLNNPNNFG